MRMLPALSLICLLGATTAAAQDEPRFDVASVRANTGSDLSIPISPNAPDGFTVVNRPLESLVRFAYDVQAFRVIGLPAWTREARYDITAKAQGPISDAERRVMVRALLAERFNLKTRFDTREQNVYVMTRVRTDGPLGPGLTPRPDCPGPKGCVSGGTGNPVGGFLRIRAVTLDRLADGMLSSMLEQVVRDESKTEGVFDVDLSWRPDNASADDARPSFFTAVEEQLGLKLTPQRRPVEILVVETVERATEQ